MILYGLSFSPFVRKVLIFAAEAGIDLDLRGIGRGFADPDPDFVAASPLRKMPALRDGDYTLADSSAIIHYLDAKAGGTALLPAEPRARGLAIFFEEWSDTLLVPVGARIMFNRFVAPVLLRREGDAAAADAAEANELPPLLDFLERALGEGGDWLVGDSFTLADIACASPFLSLGYANAGPDPARHPKAAAFVARVAGRPRVAAILEAERAVLERFRK